MSDFKMRVVEFLQANGLWVVLFLAFVLALSVSAWWVGSVGMPKKAPVVGLLGAVIPLIGVAVCVVNVKIGLTLSSVGYLLRSGWLLWCGCGVGAFLRPLLFFKSWGYSAEVGEELDLF